MAKIVITLEDNASGDADISAEFDPAYSPEAAKNSKSMVAAYEMLKAVISRTGEGAYEMEYAEGKRSSGEIHKGRME